MHARFDRAHSRVVDAEIALVRLDAELAAKTIMFGNIVAWVPSTAAAAAACLVLASGNVVGRINEVTVRRAGLVRRWVTVLT